MLYIRIYSVELKDASTYEIFNIFYLQNYQNILRTFADDKNFYIYQNILKDIPVYKLEI
jgi:hypothetical protein